MSPFALLLQESRLPWVAILGFLGEWWAVWFALGRNFTRTWILTLSANLVSQVFLIALVESGALEGHLPGAEAATSHPWYAWLAAWAALSLASLGLERSVLAAWMRRWRPGWRWNRYDLWVILSANAFWFACAGLVLLKA
ncbi:MAG: hypothetical protein DWQ01_03420 [Planctomycetota bacterium]|nr:MAG: hypothetical protein DWQ01_03420 [Planctomycetota bacterium]